MERAIEPREGKAEPTLPFYSTYTVPFPSLPLMRNLTSSRARWIHYVHSNATGAAPLEPFGCSVWSSSELPWVDSTG